MPENAVKILLVEDDEIDRMAFERFVKRENLPYEYTLADSVAGASEVLRSQEFDVILLDYNLGDGTAFDIFNLGPEAPIIVITGSNQIDIAVAAMKMGAYDYIIKDQERHYLYVLPLAVDGAMRRREAETKVIVLSHAVESATESIFIANLAGRIAFLNEAAAATYGYREEDIVGQNVSILGETGSGDECYHRRADGSEFPVSVSSSAVKDSQGNDMAFVLMTRDITERKRAEEELKRINAELDGYAHTVSHDLKGPLAAMVLATSTLQELMRTGKSDQQGKEISSLLGLIEKNVWKSSALIDDLLALAEAGQQPTDVQEVDVSGVVERIREENSGDLEKRSAVLAATGPLGSVRASPTHLYQLFSNLIRNCIKHCDAARPEINVELLEDSGGSHRYLVRDNGSGVPTEYLDQIFTPFFRGESGGTGIGLATVEKIVKLYGGEVRAYNDGGACFEFSLVDYV